ncbi:MAG: PqqD family protein [Myxococcota bacterium]|nr:PqqD family protein [Myxococcota bacterium]
MAADVRFRQIDDEIVIVDLAGGEYFALNNVGAKIWQALAAGETPSQIAVALGLQYGVAPETVLRDCLDLVGELLACGLARRVLG